MYINSGFFRNIPWANSKIPKILSALMTDNLLTCSTTKTSFMNYGIVQPRVIIIRHGRKLKTILVSYKFLLVTLKEAAYANNINPLSFTVR